MSDPLVYTTVIGLEVHVQLLTRSKLFCGCSTKFGEPPNTQTCPICIGMPGVLPVMNRRAFDLALKTAVSLNCEIAPFTKWDRKNYYYPDLPKNYQISQYDLPFSHDGYLEIPSENGGEAKRVGIIRVHLEEDAGKLLHSEHGGDSQVDLNRAGTPLLEIVTQPDLRSPAEAKAFLTELKLLLTYLGVSDCNMQEGSLRVDANVNVHVPDGKGHIATPITEVKNLNSFRAVERAMTYEAQRQFEEWKKTGHRLGDVPKETRGWDDPRGVSTAQRSKEEASDYRYFPEPDLVPVAIQILSYKASGGATASGAAGISVTYSYTGGGGPTLGGSAKVSAILGESPESRRHRFETQYELPPYDADVLVSAGSAVADYFEQVASATQSPKLASNWIMQDVLRTLNECKLSIGAFPVRADGLGDLINRVQRREINTNTGREVLAQMIDSGKSAAAIIAERGLAQVADTADLAPIIDRVIAANAQAVADYRGGKQAAIGALIGKVMKETKGQADAALVRKMLLEKLQP